MFYLFFNIEYVILLSNRRLTESELPTTALQFLLILLQLNISNKSLDLYTELRSNISSLLLNKHIDSRYTYGAIYTYVFDIFRFAEWDLYLPPPAVVPLPPSWSSQGG